MRHRNDGTDLPRGVTKPLFDDERSITRKSVALVGLIALFFIVGSLHSSGFIHQDRRQFILLLIAFVAALPFHELIHYVAWCKVTGERPKWFTNGGISIGLRAKGDFTVRQAMWTTALPVVMLPILLIFVVVGTGVARRCWAEALLAVTFGSAGDLYYFRRLAQFAPGRLITESEGGYIDAG